MAPSGNIWSSLPVQQIPSEAHHRPYRWVVNAVVPLILILLAALLVLLPASLTVQARLVLFIFAATVVLWSSTSFNGAYVALAAVVSLVLLRVTPQEVFFDALASDVIWLMIGAFILGGAIQQTGLAARLTARVVGHTGTVGAVFWRLTTLLIPLALVIPSTSGRAAIAIPVFRSVVAATRDKVVPRALAILIPTIILVSTAATLIAAGSHLVAVDLLNRTTGVRITYTTWLLYGLPFGVVASYLSTAVVVMLFLPAQQRKRPVTLTQRTTAPLSIKEKATLAVVVLMVVLWLTEHWHGIEIATVTVLGALLLTLPGIGVLAWKKALQTVSWNLILFVGAAIVMGRTLIDTGTAAWIIQRLFSVLGVMSLEDPLPLLLILSLLTLTAHLYITSHTARTAAMIPALLLVAAKLEINPVALVFISTVGLDYCLTFPVSSKALLMFHELESQTYQPADLLKLSAVLLIVHLALILVFYYAYWRWIGLALS